MPRKEEPMTQAMPGGRAAWAAFTTRLAAALAAMPPETYLVLVVAEARGGNRFVQFASRGDAGLLVESVGDAYLPDGQRLSPGELERLGALGWDPPQDVDGASAGNFHRTWSPPIAFGEAASTAIATLRDVHGVAQPGDLRVKVGAFAGGAVVPPDLGLEPEPPTPKREPPTITLREVRDDGGWRSLRASLRPDGGLAIDGHDLGPGVEAVLGAGTTEYEWTWSVEPSAVQAVVTALGGEPGDDVLAVLAHWALTADGADPGRALRDAGIPIGFWNRAGD